VRPAILHVPDPATLVSFTVAAFVVVLVPGITVSAVVSTALARGLAGGLLLEIGAQLARLSMVIVVAVALQAVTGLVAAAFDVIKYAGAAYLVYLGVRYLVSENALHIDQKRTSASPWRQVASGFLVLWGNPKALLFFGAFLPQFVDPRYPAWPQAVLLGLIEMGAALASDGLYIALALTARQALAGRASVWVNRLAGVLLIGAAVWLALQREA
jgi:threonine/homoserine/homoserine lactone efflux protein